MKKFIAVIGLAFLINCVKVEESTSFKQEYQREICDKYSLYANTMDVEGSVSLYTEDAIVNNNGRNIIQGLDQIRLDFIEWYANSESINHSAEVIAAYEFDDKAFAYGRWKVDRISKDGVRTTREGHWSTHNVKVDGKWKMAIDHTNNLYSDDK